MLPSGDDLGEGRTTPLSDGISDWTMLAETLVTLTERDTHLIKIYRYDTVEASKDELSKIEAAYLRTSFDLPLGGATEQSRPSNRTEDSSRGSHLGVVRKRLEELLQRDATPLLNLFEPDVSMSDWMVGINRETCVTFTCIFFFFGLFLFGVGTSNFHYPCSPVLCFFSLYSFLIRVFFA